MFTSKSGYTTDGTYIKFKSGFTGNWVVEIEQGNEYFKTEKEADEYIAGLGKEVLIIVDVSSRTYTIGTEKIKYNLLNFKEEFFTEEVIIDYLNTVYSYLGEVQVIFEH